LSTKEEAVRTAALVLGIIGGVLGLLAGLLEITIGGVAAGLEAEGGGEVAGLGFATFALAVVGIVGGAVTPRSPGWGAILLVVAGVGGFITASLFWLLSGPLLLVGALLAFLSRRQEARAPVATS
jgi:hypothetical protein